MELPPLLFVHFIKVLLRKLAGKFKTDIMINIKFQIKHDTDYSLYINLYKE